MAVPFQFGANDRFDSGLRCCLGKFHRAVEIIFVSQCNCGKLMAFGQINNGFRGKRGIEEGVVTVDLQRNWLVDGGWWMADACSVFRVLCSVLDPRRSTLDPFLQTLDFGLSTLRSA